MTVSTRFVASFALAMAMLLAHFDIEAVTTPNGGEAIEDAPGIREGNGMKMYLAYLRDPDGNKLCALHRVTD
jgi:hypothetical protein